MESLVTDLSFNKKAICHMTGEILVINRSHFTGDVKTRKSYQSAIYLYRAWLSGPGMKLWGRDGGVCTICN